MVCRPRGRLGRWRWTQSLNVVPSCRVQGSQSGTCGGLGIKVTETERNELDNLFWLRWLDFLKDLDDDARVRSGVDKDLLCVGHLSYVTIERLAVYRAQTGEQTYATSVRLRSVSAVIAPPKSSRFESEDMLSSNLVR